MLAEGAAAGCALVSTAEHVRLIAQTSKPAVPLPVPCPVAVKIVPTAFDDEPISVKSVEPVVIILYLLPLTNEVAGIGVVARA